MFCSGTGVGRSTHASPQPADGAVAQSRLPGGGRRPHTAPPGGPAPSSSTVTGRAIEGTELDAGYWAANLRRPVLLDQAIDTLLDAGHDVFVEISGHPMLVGALTEKLGPGTREGVAVASLHRDQSGRTALLGELGRLYCAGFPVDWTRLYGAVPRRWSRCPLTPGSVSVAGSPASRKRRPRVKDPPGGDSSAALRRRGGTLAERRARRPGGAQRCAGNRRRPLSATPSPPCSPPSAWHRESIDRDAADALRYRVAWTPASRYGHGRAAPDTWLVVAPRTGWSRTRLTGWLRAAIAAQGGFGHRDRHPPRTPTVGRSPRALDGPAGREPGPARVVSLLALDETPLPDQPGLARGVALTLALAQALGGIGVSTPLWLLTPRRRRHRPEDLVTRPVQALAPGDWAGWWSLEHPERWGGLVDVGGPLDEARGRPAGHVALSNPDDEDQIALRPAGLLARRLVRGALRRL
ncbi:acyltransferase domain-containing protein [Streptomyces sp. L7]